jgi:hypothetical protein
MDPLPHDAGEHYCTQESALCLLQFMGRNRRAFWHVMRAFLTMPGTQHDADNPLWATDEHG